MWCCEVGLHNWPMSNRTGITKLASIAAIAASSLFVAPSALADKSLLVEISKQLKSPELSKKLQNGHGRDRQDGRGRTVLRECGSSGYRSNTCYFDVGFNVADARVHDRKSKGSCDEGDEWGLRGNSMWIRDGCRAIFELSSERFPEKRHRDRNDSRYGHDRDNDYYGHDRRNGNDRHDRNDRYHRISYSDQRLAIGGCAREANKQAYRYDAYSAQYTSTPRLERSRHGSISVTGIVRVHDSNGFRNKHTTCRVDTRGRVSSFRFDR